jgi:uncharacterized Zn finger protein
MPWNTRTFALSWWAQRWLAALDTLGEMHARRLSGSRHNLGYQQVYPLDVVPGRILARAGDQYGLMANVRISLRVLPEAVWERVTLALSEDPGQLTLVLAHLPAPDFERIIVEAGGWLFPHGAEDLRVWCSRGCQWQGFCPHVAAVLNAFALRLESEPELLLALRGCPRETLVRRVRERWMGECTSAEPAEERASSGTMSLPDRIIPADFYGQRAPLPEDEPPIEPAQSEMPLLRRLGPPPFTEADEDTERALAPAYALVTRRATQTWERTGLAKRAGRRGRANR